MEMKLLAAVADSAERAIENNIMVLDNSSSVKGEFSADFLMYVCEFRAIDCGVIRFDWSEYEFLATPSPQNTCTINNKFWSHLDFAVSLETLPPPPPPPVNLYTATTNHLNVFNDPRRSQSSVSTTHTATAFKVKEEEEEEKDETDWSERGNLNGDDFLNLIWTLAGYVL